MLNLSDYTTGLIERDGILTSKKESKISYPEVGNDNYFQVEENSFWFKHRNNCITEAVLKYSPGELFFDIGGGNGYVAKGLEEKGIATVLIEPGIRGCLNARQRKLKNIVCSTLENAGFNKNSLPAIGLFDVVEHIENDLEFLQATQFYLKEDGLVFITVPAYNMLWSDEDDKAGHFRRYTLKSLENTLKAAGFQIEYSTYIFAVLPFPIFLFRSLLTKIGLTKPNFDLELYKKVHHYRKGIFDPLMQKIWETELNMIRKGKEIPFGGSCFAIARKK